jgi:hypothetical protein
LADGLEGADFSATIYQCQVASARESDLSRGKREYFARHGHPAILADLKQRVLTVRIADVVAKRPAPFRRGFHLAPTEIMLALFFVVTRIRSFIPGFAIFAQN